MARGAKIDLSVKAAEPCVGAPLPSGPHPSREEYRVFGLLQTGYLDVCEVKRALAVDTIKLHNEVQDRLVRELEYPNWFERWFLGRR